MGAGVAVDAKRLLVVGEQDAQVDEDFLLAPEHILLCGVEEIKDKGVILVKAGTYDYQCMEETIALLLEGVTKLADVI